MSEHFVRHQICGINTVLYHGSLLFAQYFRDQSMKLAIGANVIVGLVNLIFTLPLWPCFYRPLRGRRQLFLLATAGMAVLLTILVTSLKLEVGCQYLIFGGILAFFAVGLVPGVGVY